LLVSDAAKKIPSSRAHQLVKESPLWAGRVERASARFEQARKALAEGDITRLARIAWSETWEIAQPVSHRAGSLSLTGAPAA